MSNASFAGGWGIRSHGHQRETFLGGMAPLPRDHGVRDPGVSPSRSLNVSCTHRGEQRQGTWSPGCTGQRRGDHSLSRYSGPRRDYNGCDTGATYNCPIPMQGLWSRHWLRGRSRC
ncbi:uncharacterized protein ACIBXB_022132 isoform 4-T4 [Morphnus guianensis]